MADKKISQLTGATTPLAGTEVLPIVQSGSTVKVSIDNLTKGKTVNATSFDTDVAAAGVTLSGTTLSADGSDTNIDINITPKGTGEVNITKADIDGGSIDGTTIGGSSAAAGTFTALNASGNVALNGGSFVFNDSAADKDFRIEGVSDAQIFFTDASTNAVGFGTTDPNSLGQVAIVKSNSTNPLFVVRDDGTPTGFYVSYVSTNALGTLFGVQSDGDVRAGVGNFLVATGGKGIKFAGNGDVIWRCGENSPEGAVTAPVGSLFTRTNGGANTTLYVKESGAGNTGWVAK